MDLATMVLQQNDWHVPEPDAAGLRVMEREVTSLRTGATYRFRIEHVDGATEATLTVFNGDRVIQVKTDVWPEIASDGVAVPHHLISR
jgi:hypothetical protein